MPAVGALICARSPRMVWTLWTAPPNLLVGAGNNVVRSQGLVGVVIPLSSHIWEEGCKRVCD